MAKVVSDMFSSLVVISFGLILTGVWCDHYPDKKFNRKPCLRRKNTIQYQGAICQQSSPGIFDADSVTTCKEVFRTSTCPELNKGDCELCNISSALYDGSNGTQNIGCCKLYYKAEGNTWAEIFFANQYDRAGDLPVFDIVEIRRNILKESGFGDRKQEDWPKSVIDPKGERGLGWKLRDNPEHFPVISTQDAICGSKTDPPEKVNDPRCHVTFLNYLKDNWFYGFEPTADENIIEPSNWEMENNATISYEFVPRCMYVLINMKRTTACQVTYIRRARFNYSTNEDTSSYTPITRLHDSSFEFLEVQLYNLPVEKWTVRYAYWNQEPSETRDEIFSNGA